jgi:hypothetical protein
MPYGLFDYADMVQPMGLSPQAPDFVPAQKIPATTPPNTGLVTRAFPETPPSPTNPLVPSVGLGNDMLENPFTLRIPENPPTQVHNAPPIGTGALIGSEAPPNMTLACIPSEGCNPNPAPVTMAIPENGGIPMPPSGGQCPAGYESSNQSSSAPVKPPSSGYQFYDGGEQYQVGSGLGGGGGGGLPKWNASQMVEVLDTHMPWNTASRFNQLGITTAR